MHDSELWARIEAHPIGRSEGREVFVQRLMDGQGWSEGKTEALIDEYKRFCYLAIIKLDLTRAPSPQIDQIWHQHLTWTRTYWDEFCGQVLRAPLHHEPSQFGTRRYDKKAWTTSYQAEFHKAPGAWDWWPGPHPVEADRIDSIRWINTKPLVFLPPPPLVLAATCCLSIGLVLAVIGFWVSGLLLLGVLLFVVGVLALTKLNGFLSTNRSAERPPCWLRASSAARPASELRYDRNGKASGGPGGSFKGGTSGGESWDSGAHCNASSCGGGE
jgi:hypothetical protein